MYLLFLAVWLILNGKVTWEIFLFGIVISAVLFLFMCRFLDYSLKKEVLLFRLSPLFARYFWVLVKEIVKANVCVLKIIFSMEMQPEPAFVYFDTDFKTATAKVLLANSITLTPEPSRCRWRETGSVSTAWTGNWQTVWRILHLWNY